MVPRARGGGLVGEVAEVAGRAAEDPFDVVGEKGVAPVEQVAEELDEEADGLVRQPEGGEVRGVRARWNGRVADGRPGRPVAAPISAAASAKVSRRGPVAS